MDGWKVGLKARVRHEKAFGRRGWESNSRTQPLDLQALEMAQKAPMAQIAVAMSENV